MRYVTLAVLLGPFIALGLSVVVATPDGIHPSPSPSATLLPMVWNSVAAILFALGLGVGLGLLLARLGEAVESFDLENPPALFRIAAYWRRALRSPASDRVDTDMGATAREPDAIAWLKPGPYSRSGRRRRPRGGPNRERGPGAVSAPRP